MLTRIKGAHIVDSLPTGATKSAIFGSATMQSSRPTQDGAQADETRELDASGLIAMAGQPSISIRMPSPARM